MHPFQWIAALFVRAILLISLIEPVASAPIDNGELSRSSVDATGNIQKIANDYAALDRANAPGDVLPIRSLAEIATRYDTLDKLLTRLHSIDPATLTDPTAIAYSILLESMESLRALRSCRTELWDINHIAGWQVRLPPQAAAQSVRTPIDRARALRRWASFSAYVDNDIANLRTGLEGGYSVPKTVVLRVLQQIEALLRAAPNDSPFAQAAATAEDPLFQRDWNSLVAENINPSIKRFGEFLRTEYLPKARDGISVSDLPDGARCYAAFLRRATTLDRSPVATFALGRATVARSRIELTALGSKMFGTQEVKEILRRVKAAPANRFKSPAELLSYSATMLTRSTQMSAAYFFSLPQQAIEIAPMPVYQQRSGISSHYEGVDSLTQPAFFRIDLDDWANETRGAAAVTAVHEAIPGHHLQTVIARTVKLPGATSQFSFNAAFVEGWANYVERLCEEAGMYDNPYAAVFRRSVLGESLMIDPAVHVMGWSRNRLRKYLNTLGQTNQEADELIDRIAVQPAQLTSYETGGLEIFALREEAKAALGSRFDIREFHQRVLESGDVPLSRLREQVRSWIRLHF